MLYTKNNLKTNTNAGISLYRVINLNDQDISEATNGTNIGAVGGVPFKGTIVGNFKASSVSSSGISASDSKNVPKWFKPSGK